MANFGRRISILLFGSAAMMSLLGACVAMETNDVKGTWTLTRVGGQQIQTSTTPPGFTIDGNLISGYDGCNQFGGPLDDPASMRVGQRACAGDIPIFPLDLSDPGAHIASGSMDGGRLLLPARNGLPSSEFNRAN